jgi:integrase
VKSRRVVPIDAWLADDLRAYLANDHPHGDPLSADSDPAAPLFPGRYGMTEAVPQQILTRLSRCGRWSLTPTRRLVVALVSRIDAS